MYCYSNSIGKQGIRKRVLFRTRNFMKEIFDIDFVIPWVDGSDPEWIAEFNKYAPKEKRRETDASEQRYRDYGLLRYWFRGVEKFAPWVRTVHFVTCGQKPDWLNLDAPKLHWVKHSDYIPQEYLPVFSSHPIELMMHKIPGLAEQIVYFNDDLFLTSTVRKNFFFKNGLPRDSAVMEVKSSGELPMLGINFNNLNLINAQFIKHSVIRKNFFKWFSLRYGRHLWKNVSLLPWPKFCGFLNPHMPQPFTKSCIEEVWKRCGERLDETMTHRFRSPFDVNQWLFRHWALCEGKFAPIHPTKGRQCFDLTDGDTEKIANCIKSHTYKEIVINDSEIEDFDIAMEKIKNAFELILPEKSTFEI